MAGRFSWQNRPVFVSGCVFVYILPMRLTSSEIRYLRSLTQKKTRAREGKFLLEGWRALREALQSSVTIERVAVLERFVEDPDYEGFFRHCRERKVPVGVLSEKELKTVSDTVHAQGVVAVVREKKWSLAEVLAAGDLLVAADAVADPGNTGSILRTCDWFGVSGVLLGQGTVELHNEKVIRSTVGSIFHLPVVEDVDLPAVIPQLQEARYDVWALDAGGRESLEHVHFGTKNVLIVGSEAHGVSAGVRRLVRTTLRIPRFGHAESLNAGVACGVVLSHLRLGQAGSEAEGRR